MRGFIVLCLLFAAPAAADKQAVAENLKRTMELDEVSVSDTPLPGIYQIIHRGEVFYASEDGNYLLKGPLIDLAQNRNLTKEALKGVRKKLNGVRKKMLASLGQNRLIPFAAPGARHEVVVFTDVTCGFCRKFHRNIRKMNSLGITVNYLLTPVLSEQAHTEAVNVWCARDRSAALTAAKLGKSLPGKQCENPIESNLRLTRLLEVRGTPAIFLADGTLLPGYVEPDQLLHALEQ